MYSESSNVIMECGSLFRNKQDLFSLIPDYDIALTGVQYVR